MKASRNLVKPRDAASLLIFRNARGAPEVLVGRRHKQARFLPDVYVFPGGALDAPDYRGPPVLLADADVARMGVGGRAQHGHALVRAAMREAREETGLTIQTRTLTYVGRAITPPQSPVRFHARFFSAPFARCEGSLQGDGELQDLRWMPLRNPDQLPLVDVTEFMLSELACMLTGETHLPALLCYRGGIVRVVRYTPR